MRLYSFQQDSDKDKDKLRERERDKEKGKASPTEEKMEIEQSKGREDVKVQQAEPKKEQLSSVTTTSSSSPSAGTSTATVATTGSDSISPRPVGDGEITQENALQSSLTKSKEEVLRHASIDSEQELPSSTIKTPDFSEDASTGGGEKKDGEQGNPTFQSILQMPELGEFKASFHNVSHNEGTLKGQYFPESPVPIVGRISPQTVWDYIDKMKKTKEIITFRLTPASQKDAHGYMNFFSYLSSRERLGVIGGLCQPLKDVYLIPLDKHHPVPRCLLPFAGPGLPQERQHCLLAVVTRHMPGDVGLKRKLSSGAQDSSSKKKVKGASGEQRVLRSGKAGSGLSRKGSATSSVPPPPPPTSESKEDDNEPYTPWGDDEDATVTGVETAEGYPPTTTTSSQPTLPISASATVSAEDTANKTDVKQNELQLQLQEIEAQIQKEKQSLAFLTGSQPVVGIPGLDGDFPEEEVQNESSSSMPPAKKSKEDVAAFLRQPSSAAAVTTTTVAAVVAPSVSVSQSVPQGLSSLDPRSTRSSIFKNQQPATQLPPVLTVQSKSPPVILIPGFDTPADLPTTVNNEGSSSPPPPRLEPEPEVVTIKEDSEEAYSPSAMDFSDEEERAKNKHSVGKVTPPIVDLEPPSILPIPVANIMGDIDERQLTIPPIIQAAPVILPPPTISTVCGDIDERIIPRAGVTDETVPPLSASSEKKQLEEQPVAASVPPVILNDKQTEEIKIILSKINANPVNTSPSISAADNIAPKEPGIVDLVVDTEPREPLPPGVENIDDAPPLPPLNPPPSLQSKNKVFEDSPFEKSPVLKLGGGTSTPGKMKININLSTKSLPAAPIPKQIPDVDSRGDKVSADLKTSFKDIDERVSPMKDPQQQSITKETFAAPPIPVEFMSVPPSVLLSQPPPPLAAVPLHLPPPPVVAPPPAVTTGSVVVNLTIPPPPFISRPPSAFPPLMPGGSPVMPPLPLAQAAQLAGSTASPTLATNVSGPPADFMTRQPQNTSPRTSFGPRGAGGSVERGERDPGINRGYVAGRGSRWDNNRRRVGRDDRRRFRSRSRSRSRSRGRSRYFIVLNSNNKRKQTKLTTIRKSFLSNV